MMYTIYCNIQYDVLVNIIFEMKGRKVVYLPSAAPRPATLQKIFRFWPAWPGSFTIVNGRVFSRLL